MTRAEQIADTLPAPALPTSDGKTACVECGARHYIGFGGAFAKWFVCGVCADKRAAT